MKQARTWVLIADEASAFILTNDGTGRGFTVNDRLAFHGDHATTHDLGSDREGRRFSSHGSGRSAIDARSAPRRELK